MTTTTQSTALVMSTATLEALALRAGIHGQRVDAKQLLAAIDSREAEGMNWRVRCDEPALSFILALAPEIAQLWPEVFGAVKVPRAAVLAQFGHEAVGQTVAGVEIADTLRITFESGDALLIGATGQLDWRAG